MKLKTLCVVSSFALVAAMIAPAQAQDAAEPEQEEEDGGQRTNVIVVTAEFREADLQDTPIAITAVNSEMLDARGQTDISQVAAQAPNVTLKPQPQRGGAGLIAFIRGVGQVDFNFALDPGVGIYVDDVYIPTLSSSLLDLMDLDRIEVLRGPQGTLAGKNSIGGAIKLFSSKPDGSGTGSLQVTYGSYDRLDIRGIADFEVTNNLFARVAGVSKSRDGHVTLIDYGLSHPGSNVPSNNARGGNADWGTLGGQSYAAGKLSLRWLPTETIEVNVSGDYTSDRSEAGAEVVLWADQPAVTPDGIPWLVGLDGNPVPADCRFVPAGANSCDTPPSGFDPRYISYANFLDAREPTSQAPYKPYAANPIQEFTGWGVQGNVTAELMDNLQLVWIGSWREYESKFGQDQDGTPVPVAQLDNQLNHRAWSQEVRLNGEFGDGMIEYTVGGFYFDQDGRYTARVDLNYAGIDFIHGPDTTPSTSKALFFNGTFRPVPDWSISGGIRHSWDEKIYTYYRSNPDGSVPFEDWTPAVSPAPICEAFLGLVPGQTSGVVLGNSPNCLLTGLYGISDSFKGERWDWRIVTDYRFSEEFLAYASVATGFKGGGVNPRPFFGPSAGDCNAPGYVAPAPCNQLKSFDPETIITYEVGFKTDLFDRRLRLNGAAFYNEYDNIILELSACPSIPCLQPNNVGEAEVKGFELEMSAFPVDGLSLDGSLAFIDFQYKDTGSSGVSLDAVTPFTPEWTYAFGVQYDHEIEPGTISLRFDGSYQSTIYSEAFNRDAGEIDAYFLGNARLSFTTADDDWRVSLEVQNLFDKYYFYTKSDVVDSLGVITGAPGLPRTWAVSLKRNF